MADKERFDELYRAGIRRMRYPAPPELDWDELARAAAAGRSAGRGAGIAWGVSFAVAVTAVGALLWFANPDPSFHRTRTSAPTLLSHSSLGEALDAASRSATTIGRVAKAEVGEPDASSPQADPVPGPLVTSRSFVGADSGPIAPDIKVQVPAPVTSEVPQHVDEASDQVRIGLMELLPTSTAPLNATPVAASAIDLPHPVFPRWSVSPWFSLDHVDRVDDKDRDEQLLAQVSSDHGITCTSGLRVRFAWDERLSVYTGAQLSWKGTLKGTLQTSAVQKAEYDLSGRYLEVPIGLRFATNKERWSAYARAGIQLQFNLRPGEDHIVLYNYVLKEMRTVRLASSSMGVSGEVAAGVEFRAGKRMAVFVEPVYRLGFTPAVQQSYSSDLPLNPKERSFGLATGLVYHLSVR